MYYQKFILLFKAPCKRTNRNIVGSRCVLPHEAKSLTGFKLCATTPKVSRLINETCDAVDTCFDCEQRVESESERRGWKLNGFGETIAAQQHSHIEFMPINWGFF